MLDHFRAHDAVACFAGRRPPQTFHVVASGRGTREEHPPREGVGMWINGGFFVVRAADLRLDQGRRGAGRGALPAARCRGNSCSPTPTTASGRAWIRSRTSSSSRPVHRAARPPGRSGRPTATPPLGVRRLRHRAERASTSRGAQSSTRRGLASDQARALSRRPLRRPRDRLRRHRPHARREPKPPAFTWVVFSSDASREAEARSSAERFLRGAPNARIIIRKFREGSCRTRAAGQGGLRGAQGT